jgi:predicted nucleic acid-binding Zn ribbon protein
MTAVHCCEHSVTDTAVVDEPEEEDDTLLGADAEQPTIAANAKLKKKFKFMCIVIFGSGFS